MASWNVGADGLRRALDDESRAAAGAVSLALARDFVNLVIDRANGDDARTTPCGMRAARRGAPRPTPPHITGALRATSATDDDDDVDARLSAKARKGRSAHARAARDNPPSVMCVLRSIVRACVRGEIRDGARVRATRTVGKVGQVALGNRIERRRGRRTGRMMMINCSMRKYNETTVRNVMKTKLWMWHVCMHTS